MKVKFLILFLIICTLANSQFELELGVTARANFGEGSPYLAPIAAFGVYVPSKKFIIRTGVGYNYRYREPVDEHYVNNVWFDFADVSTNIFQDLYWTVRTENLFIQEYERTILTGVSVERDIVRLQFLVGGNFFKKNFFSDHSIPIRVGGVINGIFLINGGEKDMICPKF